MLRYFLVFAVGFLAGGFVWHSGFESGLQDRQRNSTPGSVKTRNNSRHTIPPQIDLIDPSIPTYKI